jgi:acetylornithine deacetylase/succinyl-diaminopimelate desuccinylase-like protein
VSEPASDIAVELDHGYLLDRLLEFAAVPTAVSLGYDTLMAPDDPLLIAYVQNTIRPELERIGCEELIAASGNNLIVRIGSGESGRSLLIQSYTPAQHHHHMADPFKPRVVDGSSLGLKRPVVVAQGVSQAKAHQAVMVCVLKALNQRSAPLRGTLYWSTNNEGRSSHECTRAILAALDRKPDFGVIQIDTGMRVTLGNRGRTDVEVHVEGRVAHSSEPGDGLSAIPGLMRALQAIEQITWPDAHPLLGRRQAIPYKVRFAPVAPHTLPSDGWATVDRRLLPGDDPAAATAEIRAAIGDLSPWRVDVAEGVTMLPALVSPDDQVLGRLRRAIARATGAEPELFYSQASFDAGGLTSRSIPAVMFGAGGGIWPDGPDFVPIEDVEREAAALAAFVTDYLS